MQVEAEVSVRRHVGKVMFLAFGTDVSSRRITDVVVIALIPIYPLFILTEVSKFTVLHLIPQIPSVKSVKINVIYE